jgi:hypothetical protein
MSRRLIIIIVLLLLSLASVTVIVVKPVIFFSKANTSNSGSSLDNSYVFASPLLAKADGQESIRITVFLLDGRGLGIPNHPVSLKSPSNINQKFIQAISDDSGKTVFDISSTTPGKYEISALADTVNMLPQKVSVVFY